ncbi:MULTISPECIES: MurR/RpiR family transcriptional regulator [Spiroplasma]|uniref:Transcriptional regulator n=1 Tax=Spiroplasma alleghenense TaxID=216931 RepID=A0A345Z2E4_9MOLU|nr:MurR/RpiR family transcriptional regulator [Spiroplasma alleghenense]AXK50773.1 transcriptional regulator [Spiroplasma alleghenense]
MRSFLVKLATIDENILTSRETQIVEYIKANLHEIVNSNMKIERLAQEVGTGYSAIYGLLNKLNIRGYRDFSISLSNDADSQEIEVAKNDENVAASYINLIKQNYSLIEKRAIFESLKLIRKSTRIFICYWENSLMGPAQVLENFLYKEKLNCYLLDNDWDTLLDRVENLREDDLFIFYTKYGQSKHLERIMNRIKNKNGDIIYISGRVSNPEIARLANSSHTLIIENYESTQFNSYVSQSVPFHYFNDLFIYHFVNTSNQERAE